MLATLIVVGLLELGAQTQEPLTITPIVGTYAPKATPKRRGVPQVKKPAQTEPEKPAVLELTPNQAEARAQAVVDRVLSESRLGRLTKDAGSIRSANFADIERSAHEKVLLAEAQQTLIADPRLAVEQLMRQEDDDIAVMLLLTC